MNSLEKNGKEILLCGIIKSYNKNTKKKEAMLLVLQSLVYTGIKILDLYTMYLNILPQTGNKVTLSKMDSVTLLGEYLEKNGKETPLCSII